jgi:hypothetical protein
MSFWTRTPTLDRPKASTLAKKILGKPLALVSEYVKTSDGQTVRKVAWRAAAPQIESETRMIAASIQFMIAEGHSLSTDEDEVLAIARAAALWCHGLTEDDVEEG